MPLLEDLEDFDDLEDLEDFFFEDLEDFEDLKLEHLLRRPLFQPPATSWSMISSILDSDRPFRRSFSFNIVFVLGNRREVVADLCHRPKETTLETGFRYENKEI